eukprot:403362321
MKIRTPSQNEVNKDKTNGLVLVLEPDNIVQNLEILDKNDNLWITSLKNLRVQNIIHQNLGYKVLSYEQNLEQQYLLQLLNRNNPIIDTESELILSEQRQREDEVLFNSNFDNQMHQDLLMNQDFIDTRTSTPYRSFAPQNRLAHNLRTPVQNYQQPIVIQEALSFQMPQVPIRLPIRVGGQNKITKEIKETQNFKEFHIKTKNMNDSNQIMQILNELASAQGFKIYKHSEDCKIQKREQKLILFCSFYPQERCPFCMIYSRTTNEFVMREGTMTGVGEYSLIKYRPEHNHKIEQISQKQGSQNIQEMALAEQESSHRNLLKNEQFQDTFPDFQTNPALIDQYHQQDQIQNTFADYDPNNLNAETFANYSPSKTAVQSCIKQQFPTIQSNPLSSSFASQLYNQLKQQDYPVQQIQEPIFHQNAVLYPQLQNQTQDDSANSHNLADLTVNNYQSGILKPKGLTRYICAGDQELLLRDIQNNNNNNSQLLGNTLAIPNSQDLGGTMIIEKVAVKSCENNFQELEDNKTKIIKQISNIRSQKSSQQIEQYQGLMSAVAYNNYDF